MFIEKEFCAKSEGECPFSGNCHGLCHQYKKKQLSDEDQKKYDAKRESYFNMVDSANTISNIANVFAKDIKFAMFKGERSESWDIIEAFKEQFAAAVKDYGVAFDEYENFDKNWEEAEDDDTV